MKGRRLPDVVFGALPQDVELQPGDYWKYLDRETGEPLKPIADFPGEGANSNLTGTCWGYYSPDGNGIGTLMRHTVREEADGTISVRAGDGSSNSIKHSGGAQHKTWHGYIEHGEWNPV